MATVSYRLEDLKKAIVGIGYVGENDHMHVLIDCKEAFDEYPAAVPTMVIVPPVGDSYPKAVTRNGDVVEWLVKNSDVTVEGDGEFQLTFTEDEVIKKSVNGRFRVKRSISGSGEAPSGVQDWVADANEKLAAVEEATQEAEAAAEHQPKINASGYWEIWDAEQGAYVATTVKAQGDKGDPGDPGSPGDPTELIDDTAGEGVTDKTLSADKLAEKFGDVLTDIHGQAKDISDMKVPKKLIGFVVEKCINSGYITDNGELYDPTNKNYYTTDYIPVSEGDVITYRLIGKPGNEHPMYIITAYDETKTRIAEQCVGVESANYHYGTYTVASGTAFIRICGGKSSIGFYSDDVTYGYCNAEEVVNDSIGYLNFFTFPGYFGSNGAVDTAGTSKEVRTNIIPVVPNKTSFDISYKFSSAVNMWMAVAYFDSSMGFISRDTLVSESNSSKEVHVDITNNSIAYVAFTWRSYDTNPTTIRVKPNKVGEGSSIEIDDSAGFGDTGKVWSASKSYTEINEVKLNENSGYIATNGTISTADSTKKEVYTNALPVEKDDVIDIILEYASSASMWMAYALYDSSQNFISRTTIVDNVTQLSAIRSITIPSGAKYIRITYRTYGTHTVKIASSGKNRILTDQFTDNTKESDLETSIITINSNVKAINHRGYNKVAPENTIPAYRLSKRKGFNYVECDVSFTSDGVPVILHDSTINRTARNSDGTEISSTVNISDITYEEALEYDFGIYKGSEYAGTTIPTLKELVELCRNIGLHLYIELKETGSTQQLIEDCADIVRGAGMENNVTWISFSDTLLGYIKAVEPKAHLALVVNSVTSSKISEAQALKTTSNDVIVDSGSWTSTEIELCKQAKLPMEVWTIDTASTIINLDSYISGVTSDDLNAGYLLYKNIMGY